MTPTAFSPAALAVDVGGTFTDLVGFQDGRLATGKVPSTTDDQSRAVVAGATEMGVRADRFLHGTTVATNALLERSGATTALVTSSGFGDIVEIGRQDRPSLYDSFADRPTPLVPAELRFEADGDTAVADLIGEMPEIEAVAVSLLYGYRRAAEESALAAAIARARPDVAISCSSRVVPEFREFERTSTTVLNAYLTPQTGTYLRHLADRASEVGLPADIAVMRSSGGLIPIGEAAELPASILLSGPAAGVVAAAAIGTSLGRKRLISFDMGGTSTDVCRIENGRPEVAYERPVEGYPCKMASVAIHTVGAGGGSIAWVDAGGSLRVGPRSAGARPGPACYGHGGTEPAVTDASVLLGRIDPGGALAGSLPIRPEPAERAVRLVGERLGLDSTATALGIVAVVEEVMAGAIRRVSIEQGADPRGATLVAFGGAGGLHAAALGRKLEMESVVVPPYAGVFSAVGLLLSPPRSDAARSVGINAAQGLDAAVADVMDRARRGLASVEPDKVVARVDVRYQGQSHETTVSYTPGEGWESLVARFHVIHRRRNGFAREGDPVEVVTVRAEALGAPLLTWADLPEPTPSGVADRGSRPVVTADGAVAARVLWRPALAPGAKVVGPAVIEETEATTYVGPGEQATVLDGGTLEIQW